MDTKRQAERDRVVSELRRHRTPVVYDALERYGLRSNTEGYSDGSIRCILPSLGTFVGFAFTGRIRSAEAPTASDPGVAWQDVWRYVQSIPAPSIAVLEDIDIPAGRGCVWGDVSAAIYQAFGCTAAVTNGTVRDIRGVEELGFGLFASHTVVGHGYGRYVEIGKPVSVGGLTISSGDLIHADEHGILTIPAEVDLTDLLRMIEHVVACEKHVMEYVQRRQSIDLEELDRLHTWSMVTKPSV